MHRAMLSVLTSFVLAVFGVVAAIAQAPAGGEPVKLGLIRHLQRRLRLHRR